MESAESDTLDAPKSDGSSRISPADWAGRAPSPESRLMSSD
jgi:hypothetical protein